MSYRVECAKCAGRGEIKAFSGIAGGICFCCNGKGYVELKNPPKRSKKWIVSAVEKSSGEVVEQICTINAKSEAEAIKKAQIQLSRGNGYDPMSAQVKEEQ